MKTVFESGKEIIHTLFEAGHTAYFAGGWVRDFLLGTPSDEIDIATSAPPEAIQSLFPKTVPVGIAFGVVIVVHEGTNFEVATFRKDHPYHDGRHPDGVDFSTPEKDAHRRDFTINGLFFDPLTKTILDYVDGQRDLKEGVIRAIGEPHKRFEEDRLRMIRAVRFSARFRFPIDPATEAAIAEAAPTLFPSVSIERVWQELSKMAARPHFDEALLHLQKLGLLSVIFPQIGDLTESIKPFPYFPAECPPVVYLLDLFPADEHLALCSYLKLSKADVALVTFFDTYRAKPELSLTEWAHFYAHPHSRLFLEVEAAKRLPPHRNHFVEEHDTRQKKLRAHIKRLIDNKPLVRASHLEKRGVKPGKRMGELLKQAEQIAIEDDLHSADEVLEKLQL